MIKEIQGDILDDSHNFDVILHGCNCFNVMGAGIADKIRRKFPEAYHEDLLTERGSFEKLGKISFTTDCKPTIVNCYTQYQPGANFKLAAFEQCLLAVRRKYSKQKIALPRIGAGIGGGNWEEIKEVVYRVLGKCDVTIVEYKA